MYSSERVVLSGGGSRALPGPRRARCSLAGAGAGGRSRRTLCLLFVLDYINPKNALTDRNLRLTAEPIGRDWQSFLKRSEHAFEVQLSSGLLVGRAKNGIRYWPNPTTECRSPARLF